MVNHLSDQFSYDVFYLTIRYLMESMLRIFVRVII